MLGGEVQDEDVGSLEVMNSVRWLEVVGFGEVVAPCDTDPYGAVVQALHSDGYLNEQYKDSWVKKQKDKNKVRSRSIPFLTVTVIKRLSIRNKAFTRISIWRNI